ncbi:MAG: hypothetical protein QW470_06870 [Candidatus Caldarchaeum sp.]
MSKQMRSSAILVVLAFVFLLFQQAASQDLKSLCLDFSTAYDQRFKWYNTNGSLPIYKNDHYVFTGSKTTNMYQDAVSTKSIKAGEAFAVSARVSIKIDSKSSSYRDEFAVFVSDDTKVFTGDEFGFVVRQDSATVLGYLQSPRLPEFFREFKLDSLPIGVEKTYSLKAVYSELAGKAVVRFFVNDINVLTYDFPIVSGEELYLVISSKKASGPEVDTSNNHMKVYSACIVNLPVPRADTVIQSNSDEKNFSDISIFTNTATLVVMFVLALVVLKLYKSLKMIERTISRN